MYEHNYRRNLKINNGLRKFITDFKGDYCVTVVFNREISISGAKCSLKDWYVKVSRKLYGKKWHQKDAGQRLQFIAVAEHLNSNLHWHLVVKVGGAGKEQLFETAAADLWTKFNKSGSMMVDTIENAKKNRTVGWYLSKDTWREANYRNFIISDGF